MSCEVEQYSAGPCARSVESHDNRDAPLKGRSSIPMGGMQAMVAVIRVSDNGWIRRGESAQQRIKNTTPRLAIVILVNFAT